MPTLTVTKRTPNLPAEMNFDFRQGSTLPVNFEVYVKGDGDSDYAADDLSGCTVTLVVEDSDDTAQTITNGTLTVANGLIYGDSNEKLILLITATDTAAWSGIYRYELRCVYPNADDTFPKGATLVLVAGTITVHDVV